MRKGGTFLTGIVSLAVGLAVDGGGAVEWTGVALLIDAWVFPLGAVMAVTLGVTAAIAVDGAPPGCDTGAVVPLVVLVQLLVGQDAVLDH